MGFGDGDVVGPSVGANDGDDVGDWLGEAVGAGVSHVPSPRHTPLVQSRGPWPSSHFFPGLHFAHSPPPQSTDVSSPFLMSSMHVLGVGLAVGANVGDVDGAGVGDCDGLALGDPVGASVGLALGLAVVGACVGASVLSQQPR